MGKLLTWIGIVVVLVCIIATVCMLCVFIASHAHAHDPDTGESNWINDGAYVSPQTGVHCCGPSDCQRLDPKLVEATPRGLVLHAFKDELVPYSQATPSEDGHYWRCHTAIINQMDGSSTGGDRRCFFAPVGTE
jgi:hypothetical protein